MRRRYRGAQTDSTAFSVILGDLKIIVGRCYPNPCQRGPFLPMLVYSSNGGSSLYSFLVSKFGNCAVLRSEQRRLHITRFRSSSNGNVTISLPNTITRSNKMTVANIARRDVEPSQSEDLDGLHLFDVNIARDRRHISHRIKYLSCHPSSSSSGNWCPGPY